VTRVSDSAISEALTTRTEFLRRSAAVAAGTALLGSSAAYGGTGHTLQRAPRRGGVLRFAVGSTSVSENLDPLHSWNTNEAAYCSAIYDSLTESDANYRVKPVLAESWESNAQSTKWTFKLRPRVRFHDGELLTARDAAFMIRRHLDPKLYSPMRGIWSAFLDRDGIRATSDRTLVLSLNRPFPNVPLLLSYYGHGVVRHGMTDLDKETNGTGPFKLDSFVAGQGWEVERNARYWRDGLPYLNGIRGVAATEQISKVQSLVSGDTDVTDSIDISQLKVIQGKRGVRIVPLRGGLELYLVAKTSEKPFDDPRVLKAIKFAMDRKLIERTAYQGRGVLTSDTPQPSTDFFYPSKLGIRRRNIARAKELLSNAGYPSGIEIELHAAPLQGGAMDFAIAFAKSVAPAGIRVSVKQEPADTYFEKVWLQVPFYLSYQGHFHPAYRVQTSFTSGAAYPENVTPSLDGPVREAITTVDRKRQKAAWGEIHTWISNNSAYFNPAFLDMNAGIKTRVHGYLRRADYGYRWESVYLDA